MKVDPAVFRAYDIRGKVGEELTPALVEAVGRAFGSQIKSQGGQQVSVSRDNRESSRELASDFIRGVLSTGINVVDLGLTTTPMLYFSIIHWGLDGGAMITGSHTYPDYNGIKLCKKGARHIFGDELQEISNMVETDNFVSGKGMLEKNDIFDEYESEILRRVKISSTLKVGVDCGDGVAGPFAPDIFEALGCQVFRYACSPPARGGSEADPAGLHGGADPSRTENLDDLAKVVTSSGCDVGIGLDPDGDRLGVVDEKGNYVPIEKISFLMAKDILKPRIMFGRRSLGQHDTRFVCDVRSLLGFKTAVEKLGGKVQMIPTGRSFFRQKLYENPNIALGVEASGHIHINNNFYGFDDAIFAAARLLEILSKSRKPLSELVKEFPQSFYTPEIRVPYPDEKKFGLVEKVKRRFASEYDTMEVDGVRVKLDEKSWFLVRAKNTGPFLSLRFEADTRDKVLEMIGVVAKELGKYPEISDDWVSEAKRGL